MKISDELFAGTLSISGSSTINPQEKTAVASTKSSKTGTASFEEMLMAGIKEVNGSMLKADELSALTAAGEPVDMAEAMVAVAKADVSFRLLLQVRNRALSAYEEIMRLQF